MTDLLEAIDRVDGIVGLKGVAVGPSGHVVAGAGAAADECACDFYRDGHFASCAVDDFPGSGEELGEVYFAAFKVGEVGVCEDFLPEGFKFGAGAIGVECGGDGVGGSVEDEGFAELEPVGEVLANFLMGGHDVL